MSVLPAVFEVVTMSDKDGFFVIRDVGDGLSVTNDAENVVKRLLEGPLKQGQKLLYYDSDGLLDELVIKDGKFSGFGPGPSRS